MEYRLTVKKPNLLLLILLISFPSVAVVLVSPALPAMRLFFATSNNHVQQVITLAILGYAFGQLIYSPLANRFGRKPSIFAGFALFLLSSVVCLLGVMWHNLNVLLFGRLLMGLGASVGMVISFTLINDFYYPHQARPVVAYTVLAYAFMPALAITLGGFITSHLSWVECFWFLLFYGGLVLFTSSFLPETLRDKDELALKVKPLMQNFRLGFSNGRLLLFSLIYGLMSSFIYVVASGAPFIGIETIGLTPAHYGVLLLLPYCGQFVGALSAGKLSKHFSGYAVFTVGFASSALGTLMILICFLLHWVTVSSLLIPIFFIMMGLPMTYSTVAVMALAEYPDKATGSAIMAFMTMGTALVTTFIFTLLPAHHVLMMPFTFFGLIVLALLAVLHAYRRYP